jgi:hypothetical protein
MTIVTYDIFEVEANELQRGYFHVLTDYNPNPEYLQALGDELYQQNIEGFGHTASDAIKSAIDTLKGMGVSGKLRKNKRA